MCIYYLYSYKVIKYTYLRTLKYYIVDVDQHKIITIIYEH